MRAVDEVLGKKRPRGLGAGNLPVKHHRDLVGNRKGNVKVVRDHDHRAPALGKSAEDAHRLGGAGGVEPLGRLVQKEQVRLGKEELCKRELLLLSAREVVGVVSLEASKPQLLASARSVRRGIPAATSPFGQLLGHRVAHQKRLRVLRQICLVPGKGVLHAPALWLDDAGERLE